MATGPRRKFGDIFSRLDTIDERDGRTDGQTPRPTAKTAFMHRVVKALQNNSSEEKEAFED